MKSKIQLDRQAWILDMLKLQADERSISDVSGIRVGHYTVDDGDAQTGITVIMPCLENVLENKLQAACHVINGHSKSLGLMQVDELGVLESPIALTNTLCVGRIADGLVDYLLDEDKGGKIKSINVLVGECNDGKLNDIRKKSLAAENVLLAIKNAKTDFERGSVGAGRGMVCHGLKGGIGSSSARAVIEHKSYTVGALVLANYGRFDQLNLKGINVANALGLKKTAEETEKGSIIIVLATDAPLSSRQLKRVCKRATVGLAEMGSRIGHGSGDVVIGFSTKNKLKTDASKFIRCEFLKDEFLDEIFISAADATRDAIIDALLCASSVGNVPSLKDKLLQYKSE